MPANNHTAIGFERGISGISDEIDQKLLNLIWIGAQDDIRSSWGLRRTAEKKGGLRESVLPAPQRSGSHCRRYDPYINVAVLG